MDFATFIRIALTIDVMLIGYGQAQRYEGSPCTLYDGSRGICKNIAYCESIKVGLRTGTIGYHNIVTCSFQGAIQIACCADERPQPGRHRPVLPSQPNTDFVFINRPANKPLWSSHSKPNQTLFANDLPMLPLAWNTATNVLTHTGFIFPSGPLPKSTTTMRTTTTITTPKQIRTIPTVKSTTPVMDDWMKDVIREYSTTTTEAGVLPWMQDILNEYSTTPKSNNKVIQTTTLKPTLKTTAANSFWSEWSAVNPTNIGNNDIDSVSNQGVNEKLRQTTTTIEMPGWMKEILNEHSTTSSVNNGNNHAIKTTTTRTKTPTDMPSSMRDVLNEYSTTTAKTTTIGTTFVTSTMKKSSIGDGNLFAGGGNSDLHITTPTSGTRPGRVTDKPPLDDTRSRYSAGRKAESACEIYSRLPIAISWNILDGVPTNLGEFPWMAALGYRDINNDISYDCGGTLISEYYVLTAAHCAPPRRRPQVVRLGKVTLFTNDDDAVPVDIDIADTIRHPQYNSGVKKNDIALVRIARPVNFTENVRPACLRTNLGDVLPTVELIITGWGTTSATRTIRPSVLLKANVTSMPLQLCNTTLVSINRQANEPGLRQGLSESQCCAFDPTGSKDACQGDSGGPLQSFPDTTNIASIIGVVSFGVGCGTKQPSVYTRVAYYLDWIEPIVWPNA